jgi:hypothetical protein
LSRSLSKKHFVSAPQLDWLLQDRKRFPGRGWGRQEPEYGSASLIDGPQRLGLLQQAARMEPDEDLGDRIERRSSELAAHV